MSYADGREAVGVVTIATSAIVALLQAGTTSTTGLAKHFRVDVAEMTGIMIALARVGAVHRNSSTGRWRVAVVASLSSVANLDAVAEQVRYAPKAASQIERALKASSGEVNRALEQLRREGRVKRVGSNSGARWASSAWTPAHVSRAEPRAKATPAARSIPRVNGHDNGNANGHFFPPKPAPAGSWWVDGAKPDAPREAFAAAARSRDAAGQSDPAWRRAARVIEISSGRTDV